MTQPLSQRSLEADATLESAIAQLAREASIEINVQDLKDLNASRAFLNDGQKTFVSFLPRQSWEHSAEACRQLKDAGLQPVPHIPVRLLPDRAALEDVLGQLVLAGAEEVLLLSGDYAAAQGPFSRVEDAVETGVLTRHGLRRVSFAGHPEGHPKVALQEIRRAERAKTTGAAAQGLAPSLVTQFFFESEPFLEWARELRSTGVPARLVAGLAGPARISTLFKFALRCGAGPSIRALGARPSAFTKLLGDHGPQNVLRALADEKANGSSDFAGIHLFCFGGYLRTCEWLHRVAGGGFSLNASGGFDIK